MKHHDYAAKINYIANKLLGGKEKYEIVVAAVFFFGGLFSVI